MRLLNVLLVIFYLSILLSGQTRSAAQAWVDNTETHFSHSKSLISQQSSKVTDTEAPRDPENKYPVLLNATSAVTVVYTFAPPLLAYTASFNRLVLLTAAPRAPPALV